MSSGNFQSNRHRFEEFLLWLDIPQNQIVTIFEDHYPLLLREIDDPPLFLTYRGTLESSGRFLSVVGTRSASERALQAAFALGLECADAKVTTVSGFARGIDQAVHQGTLALQGPTWALMGSGLAGIEVLPRTLVEGFINRGGTFLSEFHPQAAPLPWRFPVRNRIIAGISMATVVVQAPRRSGALITADHALRQGRDVLVHRFGLEGAVGAGGRILCESGAPVIGWLGELVETCKMEWEIGRKAIRATTDMTGKRYRFGACNHVLSEHATL
jgi:DNA processing protein